MNGVSQSSQSMQQQRHSNGFLARGMGHTIAEGGGARGYFTAPPPAPSQFDLSTH